MYVKNWQSFTTSRFHWNHTSIMCWETLSLVVGMWIGTICVVDDQWFKHFQQKYIKFQAIPMHKLYKAGAPWILGNSLVRCAVLCQTQSGAYFIVATTRLAFIKCVSKAIWTQINIILNMCIVRLLGVYDFLFMFQCEDGVLTIPTRYDMSRFVGRK